MRRFGVPTIAAAGVLAACVAAPAHAAPSPTHAELVLVLGGGKVERTLQRFAGPDELPGRGDVGIDDEDDLRELIKRFDGGPFADRTPCAVEPAFALVLAGQVVRGRIDAVYEEQVDGHDGFLVVDWKTNRRQTADPLQVAIYRVAWAELAGVAPERVRVAFHYVRSGETVMPDEADLPDRAALEKIVGG